MLHAAQPDRAQRDRRRYLFADDLGGNVPLIDVDQHALAQLDGCEVVEVGVKGLLGIRAAVGIFEKGARNPPAGELTEVFDTGCDFHGWSAALNEGQFASTGLNVAKPSVPAAFSLYNQARWQMLTAPGNDCS